LGGSQSGGGLTQGTAKGIVLFRELPRKEGTLMSGCLRGERKGLAGNAGGGVFVRKGVEDFDCSYPTQGSVRIYASSGSSSRTIAPARTGWRLTGPGEK